jgi:hypothetical protein
MSYEKEAGMKRLISIIFMVIVLCWSMPSAKAHAESQAEKFLGEREMCLVIIRIKESVVLDDRCIIFETYGNEFYISFLPVNCPELKISGGFAYETSYDKLCKQEIIRVLGPDDNLGGTCMLGEFVRFKQKGTLSNIRKLLEGGLLDNLVKEGAFEDAFPVKK